MKTGVVGEFVGKKDLARLLGVSVRSIERYSALVKVPPTIPAWSGARWSQEDARKLVDRLANYWRARGKKPITQPA